MAHYATLQDYQFATDVDDIRGAALYGEGGEKLGRVSDIVFEHGSGNIEYLVVNDGHSRHVLVPVNRVRTSIVNDRDLDSELTREDLGHLPAFQDDMLKHDKEWKQYLQMHENALKDRDEVAQRAYKRNWTHDPVEHQVDNVADNITPVEVAHDAPAVEPERRDDYIPDLTPNRLAPIFTNTAQTSDKLNMVPNAMHSRRPAAEYQTAGLGPKWNGYQEMVRRDLPKLRGTCETCRDNEKAA